MRLLLGRIAWLPPWLLVGVALVQIWLVYGEAMSPWKGGGFGMFASSDVPSARSVRVFDGDGRRIPIPAAQRALRLRARALPTERNLRALADALGSEEPARLEVWRTELDLSTPALEETRLRVLELPGDQ